jgi:hypothetical protein
VLLTCWLAWYYLETGNQEAAGELIDWVEAQANPNGDLPEQMPFNLIDNDQYQMWRARWGEVASPSCGPTPCT